MNWDTIFQIVVWPAIIGTLYFANEVRKDADIAIDNMADDLAKRIDSTIDRIKSLEAAQVTIRESFHAEVKEIIRDYVPKQDVVRLEERILNEFRSLNAKIDRIATARTD